MPTPVLELNDISKRFPSKRLRFGKRDSEVPKAIDQVSLTVEEGETHAVVGESGAGKSTLARIALRLIEPDEGSIQLRGSDITHANGRELRSLRRRMQMVYQDPYGSFDPTKTISWSLAQPLRIHTDLSSGERSAKMADMAENVGLSPELLTSYPGTLSGGQLQRAAIARALLTTPDLLVCDEPVAALDVSIGAQVLNLISDLQDEFNFAIVFISHDLSLVQSIADRVTVMRHGQVVESGESREVFTNPHQEYTKLLLDSVPSLTAGLERSPAAREGQVAR